MRGTHPAALTFVAAPCVASEYVYSVTRACERREVWYEPLKNAPRVYRTVRRSRCPGCGVKIEELRESERNN